ncbi:hypothetical protein [Neomegalonema perideroedes]|uniref:hypothetical protein n=1 Tax=Neomegalonema perideroedes TaxID=217219 RepID=UPI00038011FE|nr:hypothetical protein [Neomegalonema perideroedes]
MGELKFLIGHYLHEIWRRRWSTLIIAWAVGLTAAFFAAKQPDVYAARATVFVDTRSLLHTLFKGEVHFENPAQQLENVRRLMYARPNLEKIIRMTDLDLRVRDEREREALVESVEKRLSLVREGQDFYRISFQHSDAEKARQVVATMVDLFVEEGISRGSGVSSQDAEQALRFAMEQQETSAARLRDAEARLAEFERENREVIALPAALISERRSLEMDLARLQGDQTLYQQEIRELEAQLRTTPQQVKTGEDVIRPPRRIQEPPPATAKQPVPEAMPTLEEQRYEAARQRATGMEREIQEMLQRLTPQHPDMVAAQRRAESARAEADGLRAAAESSVHARSARIQAALDYNAQVDAAYRDWQIRQMQPEPEPIVNVVYGENPVYAQIQAQIGQRRSRLASVDQMIQTARARLIEVGERLQRQPAVTQSYDHLEKEAGEARRELASIDDKIKLLRATNELGQQQVVKFTVSEWPKTPTAPIAPNRLILFLGSAILGLGAGLGFAFLRIQMMDTMPSIIHVREAFDLPILGGVSRLEDQKQAAGAMLGNLLFMGLASLFVMTFALLVYKYHFALWRPDLGVIASQARAALG